jgi:hypothetical protein
MNGDLTKAVMALLAILLLMAAVLLIVGILAGVRRLRPRGRWDRPKQEVNDPWGLNLSPRRRGATGAPEEKPSDAEEP